MGGGRYRDEDDSTLGLDHNGLMSQQDQIMRGQPSIFACAALICEQIKTLVLTSLLSPLPAKNSLASPLAKKWTNKTVRCNPLSERS